MNKVCPVCGSVFETDYAQRKYCSTKCCKRNYYLNNKEKVIEYTRNYYNEHKEKLNEYTRNYFAKNREKIKGYNDKWRKKNKELVTLYKHYHYLYLKDNNPKWKKEYEKAKTMYRCKVKHDNCFSCPTKNGECIYD